MRESHKKLIIRIVAIIIVIAFLATGVGIIGSSFFSN